MKVFVTLARVDGKIQSVYVWRSKRDAMRNRKIMIEALTETIVAESAEMENEGNAENVMELRLQNSSVHMFECEVMRPTK